MAVSNIDIRVNGISLQYPEAETEKWDEVLLDDILDAEFIDDSNG